MIGLYDLCSSERMEDIVLSELLELISRSDSFNDWEELRQLLSTDDDEYLDDLHRNLLLTLKHSLGKIEFEVSGKEVRELLQKADLGWGNGRRLTDRVQYLVQSLIHHCFGIEIQVRQILEGHPYLLCMDHWGSGDLIGFQQSADALSRELVRAYSSSIVYRLSATRMKNNHGGDSIALMCLDGNVIERYPQIASLLRRDPHPFRIVFSEYKTGDGRHRLPFFKIGAGSSFGAGAFRSYADELSNVARQVNTILRKAGISEQLETISLYQADPVNWDHLQMLDLSDADLYGDGYRRVLENPSRLKLGKKLNKILGKYPTVREEIVRRVLLPHMAIRQALADASTIEEFYATGRHFRFNPSRIGYKGNRDGHIQLSCIDAENPPQVNVTVRNSSIVLHPDARWFRLKDDQLVFGFDMADGKGSPFLLQENDIMQIVRKDLFPYLNRVWKINRELRQKGWKNLPVNEKDQEQIRHFLEATDPRALLLQLREGHIINFFRQVLLERLFCGRLSSLQINGNQYTLFKVVVAWGSQKFVEQLQVLCDTYAQNPCRYDQIVLTFRERVRYRSTGRRAKSKVPSVPTRVQERKPFSPYQALQFISGKIRIQMEDDGRITVVPPYGFPFTGPFFERHDLNREDHLWVAIQGLLRSANLSFSQGPDFLRFPFSKGKPSFSLRTMTGRKPSWDELDRFIRLEKKDARFIQNLNLALQENLQDFRHFQAVVEFGRFGVAKTQLSSVYGILDEWLESSSQQEVHKIAFQTANEWDTMTVNRIWGHKRKTAELGTIERNGRTVEINGRNRILWFLEGVFAGEEEPELQFREDCLSKLAELCGHSQIRLSEVDYWRQRTLSTPLFLELFARQHKIDNMAYEDIVWILLHKTKVRYQRKGHIMKPILYAEEAGYRKIQLERLATFFTPSNVFFSASGRTIATEVNLRRDAAVSLHQIQNGFPLVDLLLQKEEEK